MQLTKENHFYDEYSQTIDTIYRLSYKQIHKLAILFPAEMEPVPVTGR
ncbi:unnamed protein product, partial [Adineta steineri]